MSKYGIAHMVFISSHKNSHHEIFQKVNDSLFKASSGDDVQIVQFISNIANSLTNFEVSLPTRCDRKKSDRALDIAESTAIFW